MKKYAWIWQLITLLLLSALVLPALVACGPSAPSAYIGENGNWFIDGVDTGMSATGPAGPKGEDGADGTNGTDGAKITIGSNGNWFIDGKDSGISAAGKDGADGNRVTIGENGNWFIDGTDTGVPSGRPVDGVVLRFAVASDVHFTDTHCERDDLLQEMYEQAYAYSAAQNNYTQLDGVFFAGDVANTGSVISFERFFTAMNAHTKPGTVSLAAMGNHEFSGNSNAIADFIAAAGYESSDHHIVLNGYHFILLSPDGSGHGFSTAKRQWLDQELQKAAADDPTGKKPIFVFQHQHVKDTVYGSAQGWGISDLREVLNKYPQVVDFSGHSHFPINDPRTVWQGEFTALNTASLKGLEMDIAGVYDAYIFPTDAEGGWSSSGGSRSDGGQYYIVEVTAENEITLRAFDIRTNTQVGEIYLPSVGDPAEFVYTDARREAEETPAFPADAQAEQMVLRATRAKFRLPQAVGGFVQHYRYELYINGQKQLTSYRLSCSFLFPMPDTFTLPLSVLMPNTAYTVKVYPVTAWCNEGEPFEFSFTTPEADAAKDELLFSATFSEGDKAMDAVSGTELSKTGTPKTVYDEAQGRYVAEFDGNSAFMFHDFDECYPYMLQSVTFETYVKLGALPAANYVNFFSNQESGGIGYELKSDGRLQIFVCVDGTYKNVTVTPAVIGEWMHLAATYDGQVIVFYINGVEAGRTEAAGRISLPHAFQLVLGGDAEGATSGKHAVCSIAIANVYSAAYDAEKIASMASAYLNG